MTRTVRTCAECGLLNENTAGGNYSSFPNGHGKLLPKLDPDVNRNNIARNAIRSAKLPSAVRQIGPRGGRTSNWIIGNRRMKLSVSFGPLRASRLITSVVAPLVLAASSELRNGFGIFVPVEEP